MATTRSTLIDRIKDLEDKEAWREFHKLYAPLIYRYARARGLSRADAEEIRDECIEVVVNKISTFRYENAHRCTLVLGLEELARDMHKVPADPEPPLGENPFAAEPEVPASQVDDSEDDDQAHRAARKSEVLLSRQDMLGWKRLLRQTHREFQTQLTKWRESIGNKGPSDEEWKSLFDEGLRISEPRMALALSAVDSEIERIRQQEGLVDDFLDPPDWSSNGLECVVWMPEAIGFVYHHLLGGFLIASDLHAEAIRLLTRRVRERASNDTSKIWKNRDLIGPIVSIDRGDLRASWSYLLTLYKSRRWLQLFFHSERSFQDALRAYQLLASMLELGEYLSAGKPIERIHEVTWLDIPAMFVHPINRTGTDFRLIVSRAIPNREVFESLAEAEGCNAEQLRAAWPAWIARLLASLSALNYTRLSIQLRDLADNPPPLPS